MPRFTVHVSQISDSLLAIGLGDDSAGIPLQVGTITRIEEIIKTAPFHGKPGVYDVILINGLMSIGRNPHQ